VDEVNAELVRALDQVGELAGCPLLVEADQAFGRGRDSYPRRFTCRIAA
jgi:hypothetical protein